jgi:NAD-dependent SIR2 family protein deacetylase
VALSQFSTPPLAGLVTTLAATPDLTLVVGAGASAEAGLPSWKGLLRTLLDRAGQVKLALDDDAIREQWVEEILTSESPLGAAAVAQALASAELGEWIPEALYLGDPAAFHPGPIAREIVALRAALGTRLRILTTNYDDLIEQAFADSGTLVEAVPFVGPGGPATGLTDEGHQRVTHLHGFLSRSGAVSGEIVLTEDDYQRVAQDDWQSADVGGALLNSTCLFIGSSLTDPNLLRYLHRTAGLGSPTHYAIFTRQDAYRPGTPAAVVTARERALLDRWRRTNVEIVFVDHYMEIAQALAEIATARRRGDGYEQLPERLAAWHATVAHDLLSADDPRGFAPAQDAWRETLIDALETGLRTAGDLGYDAGDEVLGATLWLIDATGTTLTGWANTDRVHRDARTLDPVPIEEHSRWVAVRAFTRGAVLAEPRDVYASRWRYVRGLPLFTHADRLPVGVVTVSSMRAEDDTVLTAMSPTVAAVFDDAIRAVITDILDSSP